MQHSVCSGDQSVKLACCDQICVSVAHHFRHLCEILSPSHPLCSTQASDRKQTWLQVLRPDTDLNTTYNVIPINDGAPPQNGRPTYEGVRIFRLYAVLTLMMECVTDT